MTNGTRAPLSPTTVGFLAAFGAFMIWGIVNPIFFKAVAHVGAVEILAHRVIWTVVVMGAMVLLTQGFAAIVRAVGTWRRLGILGVTTVLITVNWGLFIWGVLDSRLVQVSLGYYINPLVNVVFGLLFLGERLSRRQFGAVGIAAAGVMSLVVWYGELPWVSLSLACTFGLYGLVRKKAAIDPVIGLLVETSLMFPFMLGYLIWLGAEGAFGRVGLGTDILLVAAGPVTFTPLVLFLMGTQRLKLSTIGLMQYLGPTGQLLLGVFAYGESFTPAHVVAFTCIWLALVIYSADAYSTHRAARSAAE